MQDHLVFFYPDLPVGGIPCLVRVHGTLGFIHIDEDIVFFLCWGGSVPGCGALDLIKRTPWR